jgi:hypothetical protein
MEEHLATDEEVAGSIPAAGVILQYPQTYPSGYGARLLSECPLDAQVRTLPSAFIYGEFNYFSQQDSNPGSRILVTDGKKFSGRESNPGHPRDRRIYLPLYYRRIKRKVTPGGTRTHNIMHSPRGSMEEHLATDEEVAGSIPAAGVYVCTSPGRTRTKVLRPGIEPGSSA